MKKSKKYLTFVIISNLATLIAIAFGVRYLADTGVIPELVPTITAIPLSIAAAVGLTVVFKEMTAISKKETANG